MAITSVPSADGQELDHELHELGKSFDLLVP